MIVLEKDMDGNSGNDSRGNAVLNNRYLVDQAGVPFAQVCCFLSSFRRLCKKVTTTDKRQSASLHTTYSTSLLRFFALN